MGGWRSSGGHSSGREFSAQVADERSEEVAVHPTECGTSPEASQEPLRRVSKSHGQTYPPMVQEEELQKITNIGVIKD